MYVPPLRVHSPVLHSAIGARVWRSTAQTLTTAVVTAISFDTEVHDIGGFWSAGAPTRLTAPYDGTYLLFGGIGYAFHATGDRQARVHHNGTIHTSHLARAAAVGAARLSVSDIIHGVAATDYFELCGVQDSGGNLNTEANAGITWFGIVYLGDS